MTATNPSRKELATAKKVRPLLMEKKPVPEKLAAEFAKNLHMSYAGMTPQEYSDYVKKYHAESFYVICEC